MNGIEILQLINAGYTKADIDAMDTPSKDTEKSDSESKSETPGEKVEVKDENNTESKSDIESVINALTGSLKELQATVKAMQDSNIDSAKNGKADKGAGDVIKDFLNNM